MMMTMTTKRSRQVVDDDDDDDTCCTGQLEQEGQVITKIMRTFQTLPVNQQTKLLSTIVEKCCTRKQLSFLSNKIMPMLKVDMFKYLPREITLHILDLLPVKCLCRLSQVSTYHRQLVNDGYIWKNLCLKYEFTDNNLQSTITKQSSFNISIVADGCPSPPPGLLLVDQANITITSNITDDEISTTNSSNYDEKEDESCHKLKFRSEYVLRNNWLSGKCNNHSILGPSSAIVTCLQFSDDILAIATDNTSFGLIEIFDTKHGNRIQKLTGHDGGVWALEFMENVLVSGGCDRDLRVWDLETGSCTHRLRGHTSTIRCLKMFDSKHVVTGSRDNTLRVWDIDSGECIKVFEGHAGSVRCLAVHGNIIVSGSYDFSVRVWDMKKGKLIHVLQQHHAQIYSIAFNGKYVCSGSLDADVRVWDVKSGKCIWTLEGHDALVGHMQIRDTILVTAGSDGRICVWNVETGEMVHRIQAHMTSVTTVQFDDKRIISGGDDGIKIWDLKTGNFLKSFVEDVSGVWRLQFSKTKLIAATQRQDNSFIEIMDFSPVTSNSKESTCKITSA